MSTIKFIFRLIGEAHAEWAHDRAARVGAALAYYALFSLAPLLVIMINVAGSVYGEAAAEGQIVHAISDQIGPEAAVGVEQLLAGVHSSGSSLFATLLSGTILIFAATNLFSQLKDALNTMWNVRPKRRNYFLGGVVQLFVDRLLAAIMVIILSVSLLAALSISAGLTAMNGWLRTLITPNSSLILLNGGNLLAGFGLTTLLFALTFKLLPDVQIAWRVVWVGAVVTSLLFNAGAFLIGLYLGYGTWRALGTAGSIVILMIWIAYSAQIIFFGAKFALVYADAIGRPILPAANAVSMKLALYSDVRNEEQGIR